MKNFPDYYPKKLRDKKNYLYFCAEITVYYRNMSIIYLKEVASNRWKAKYEGNYGVYTIKIKTDGKKTRDFSCSCPSEYYPCKHIAMVEKAIKQRTKDSKGQGSGDELTIYRLLNEVSQKELVDFLIRQARYNPELANNFLLEFAHKMNKKDVNNYTEIIRKALNPLHFGYQDIGYDQDCIEIETLDQWYDKAQNYIDRNNPVEAMLICMACIEEYTSWYEKQDSDMTDYLDPCYEEKPFELLASLLPILPETEKKELFKYCKSEMTKSKYRKTSVFDFFNDLFMELSISCGADDFIQLQDKLLKETPDKGSYDAQKILKRKIDFYSNTDQKDKAQAILKDNLHLESFRKELTEQLIAADDLSAAKKLIDEFIKTQLQGNRLASTWLELQLQIALKEKDIPVIRNTSFLYIKNRFDAKYFSIYKSTFPETEWPTAVESLINNYNELNNRWFNSSIADVLVAESQENRLMDYVEKYLTIDVLAKYYKGFAASFPENTLALFRKTIDKYAQEYTGREHYELILNMFLKMLKIKGGSKLVNDMVSNYRVIYKNRRAMMELLNRFKDENN